MKDLLGEYWFIIILTIPVIVYFGYYIVKYFYKVQYKKIIAGHFKKSLQINLISSNTFWKRLIKKIINTLLLIYSASFLAVVLPSNRHDPISNVIYLIGMIVYLLYIIYVIYYIYSFKKNRGLVVNFSEIRISWEKDSEKNELSVDGEIDLVERFNVFHFSDKNSKKLQLPLFLIENKSSKEEILSLFQPINKSIIEKGKQGLDVFESVIIALILAMHIRQFAIQAFYIPSGSMEMTLRIGDHLLVNKLSLGPFFPPIFGLKKPIFLKFLSFSKIKRGDILVFRPPKVNEYREYIKRVIGLPGDTFEIIDGYVYINNKKLKEPYSNKHDRDWKNYNKYLQGNKNSFFANPTCPEINYTTEQTGFKGKIKIPPDKYLMLGDHRDNSSDSRTWGLVPRESIKGKALILYFNYFDLIKNRDFTRIGLIN